MIKPGMRLLVWSFFALHAVMATGEGAAPTLSTLHPGLSSGALSFATLGELPGGMLLKSDGVEVTAEELAAELSGAGPEVKGQLEKNKLMLLESIATRRLLLQAAKAAAGTGGDSMVPEKELIQKYLEGVVAGVTVTDEEVARFYEENKDMCGGGLPGSGKKPAQGLCSATEKAG